MSRTPSIAGTMPGESRKVPPWSSYRGISSEIQTVATPTTMRIIEVMKSARGMLESFMGPLRKRRRARRGGVPFAGIPT